MVFTVIIMPEASERLEPLYLYIASEASPTTAERYAAAIITTCEKLALYPRRGIASRAVVQTCWIHAVPSSPRPLRAACAHGVH